MVKYAYSTMLHLSLSPRRAIEVLADNGLSIELSYDNFAAFGGRSVEDRYMSEVLDIASTLSRSIYVVHMPYDEMRPEVALSPKGLTRFVKWLDFVGKIGADIAVVHTLYAEGRTLDLNVEFFRSVVKEARDRDVSIAIENRLEKNMFGSKPNELVQLISLLDEEVSACLDIGHANINRNLDEFLSTAGKYVEVIHVHDNDGYRDQHKVPSTGTIDWGKVEAWIRRTGFNKFAVFEVTCRDSVNVCRGVVEYIKSLPIANI